MSANETALEHVPEKWEPVFRKGHATAYENLGGDRTKKSSIGFGRHFGEKSCRLIVCVRTNSGA